MLLSPSMGALLFTAGRLGERICWAGHQWKRPSSDRLPLPRTGPGGCSRRSGSLAVAAAVAPTTKGVPGWALPVERLAAKTKSLDERAVSVDVGLLEVL